MLLVHSCNWFDWKEEVNRKLHYIYCYVVVKLLCDIVSDELSHRAGTDHHVPRRAECMQILSAAPDSWFRWLTPTTRGQQLISEITCCGGCFRPNKSSALHVTVAALHPGKQPTVKHAAMQSCGFVCGRWRPFIPRRRALAATSSWPSAALSPTPVSVDTDKVAASPLSQRLKCIYEPCQAVTSITLPLPAQDLLWCQSRTTRQCTALLLALASHQLGGLDRAGGHAKPWGRRAEILNSLVSSLAQPSSAAQSWLEVGQQSHVLLMSKMRSMQIASALWGGEAMQRPWNQTFKETTKAGKER